jgi:hypothetical protein
MLVPHTRQRYRSGSRVPRPFGARSRRYHERAAAADCGSSTRSSQSRARSRISTPRSRSSAERRVRRAAGAMSRDRLSASTSRRPTDPEAHSRRARHQRPYALYVGALTRSRELARSSTITALSADASPNGLDLVLDRRGKLHARYARWLHVTGFVSEQEKARRPRGRGRRRRAFPLRIALARAARSVGSRAADARERRLACAGRSVAPREAAGSGTATAPSTPPWSTYLARSRPLADCDRPPGSASQPRGRTSWSRSCGSIWLGRARDQVTERATRL